MRNPFLAIAIGIAIGFTAVGAVHAVTARLEQATAEQCANKDYPANKAVEMAAFCHEFQATRQQFGRY